MTESGRLAPPDFSSEELRFARALNKLYSLEREELPPLFFQTMSKASRAHLLDLPPAPEAPLTAGFVQPIIGEKVGRCPVDSCPEGGSACHIVLAQPPDDR